MAIRMSVSADLTAVDGLEAFAANANRAVTQIMQGVVEKHGATYLRSIRRKGGPGRSRHGAGLGAWSTNRAADARARRWWFWAIGSGKIKTAGGRYVRTGKLNKQWTLTVRKNRLSLENTSERAKWVYSFAKTPRARGGRPNPGHIRTGWPQKTRAKAQKLLEDARLDVSIAYRKSIAASVASGEFVIVVP